MMPPDPDITEWLETIADERERQTVAEAYRIASEAEPPQDEADVYRPFVYPH